MSTWKITSVSKSPKLSNPVFIEGLPGIGNVGKVAVDYLIEELGAKKLFDIFSFTFPHSVFVNESNLVELPNIGIYYKKMGNGRPDLLFLAGDVQPTDEITSYEFSEKVLDLLQKYNCQEIITLGGIGLNEAPKKPKVYCTGNSKKIIEKYRKSSVLDPNLYRIVGPIVGVSGLLVGLGERRKIEGISLLAETYGHPMYLGVNGAREILKVLNKQLGLDLDMKCLNKEISEIEEEMHKSKELGEVSKRTAIERLKGKCGKEMEYIG